MSGERIKVVGEDRMCFWVDAKTLEPLGVASCDPWCFSDPEPVPTMHVNEWNSKCHDEWARKLLRR